MGQHVYSSAVFDVGNIEQAQNIILTPEGGSTQERWAKETPVIVDLISQHCALDENSVVIDYGCGIGRLSKELIAKYGCKVIGVDISASMRALAAVYVGHPHFFACAPEMLSHLGVQADLALSIWVLQHCLHPQEDIERIKKGLRHEGQLFLLNNYSRAVPTLERTWVSDGLDINALLENADFNGGATGHLPEDVCPPGLAEATFWRVYTRN